MSFVSLHSLPALNEPFLNVSPSFSTDGHALMIEAADGAAKEAVSHYSSPDAAAFKFYRISTNGRSNVSNATAFHSHMLSDRSILLCLTPIAQSPAILIADGYIAAHDIRISRMSVSRHALA
jgi:hypothetical protein